MYQIIVPEKGLGVYQALSSSFHQQHACTVQLHEDGPAEGCQPHEEADTDWQ
jgi:hypothetical protein